MAMRGSVAGLLGAALLASSLGLAGCDDEGAAEKAGKQIDQAGGDAARQIDQAAEEIKKSLGK